MPNTMTAQDYLNWSTSRALEYFDAGNKVSAFASFISDVTKHPGTAWIASHPLTLTLLEQGWSGGRNSFKRSMDGFAVSDRPLAEPEPNPALANTSADWD